MTFKDTIDNSDNLFVPKISDKPNNIKPLALNILYNDEGMAVGYEHPYQMELDLYQPPKEFIEPDANPPSFPPPLHETKLTYVETEEQVDALVQHLDKVKEMAVDVEHHSYRTYQGITCLIQITTDDGGDYIIDTLALREHLHKLNSAFTDPKKLKVFHGAEHDVLWLQRDFGVYLVGMFDTHQAAKLLHLERLSLKHLLMKYCQVNAEKKYQLADWRIRPLPEELMEYARSDTHYLLYIWRRMKAELLQQAGGPSLLLAAFEQSRQICGHTYNKEVLTDDSHMPLYLRSKKSFNSQQMSALKMLYGWRDAQARTLDESTTYLLPNHMLLSLAETLPREIQGVTACCDPMPPFVKQNLVTIHRMLLSCRELPLEPQLYQMPASISKMANVVNYSQNVHDLSQLPDFREENEINLDRAALLLAEVEEFIPDVKAFLPSEQERVASISTLNADAKLFIPPYDRYRKYRSLAQMEEIREYKEKEAKIAALGKGDSVIESEALSLLKKVRSQVETEKKNECQVKNETVTPASNNVKQRKRKISAEKTEVLDSNADTTSRSKHVVPPKSVSNAPQKQVKPFQYKNVNYNKFYDETGKKTKHFQPKEKYKKHKKF